MHNSVNKSHLRTNSVGKSEIRSRAVGQSEVGPNAIGASELRTSAVGSNDVKDETLGVNDIAPAARTALADLNGVTFRASGTAAGTLTAGNVAQPRPHRGTASTPSRLGRDVSACQYSADVSGVKNGTTIEAAAGGPRCHRRAVGHHDAGDRQDLQPPRTRWSTRRSACWSPADRRGHRCSGLAKSKRQPASHSERWLPCAGMPPESLSMRARCSRFHVRNVVLRLVKSFSGPPDPGSR